MNLRRWLIALVIYLVALAVLAPAALLPWLASRFSDGHVQLSEVSGGLWSGTAGHLEIRPLPGLPPLELDGVTWRILPYRMLWGAAPVRFENRSGGLVVSSRLAPAAGGVRLTDFRLHADLSAIKPYLSAPMTAGLQGGLDMSARDILLGSRYRGGMQGKVEIRAGRLPKGTYDLTLKGAGRQLKIRWNGPLGPHAMSGDGWWDGSSLHMDGLPGAITR